MNSGKLSCSSIRSVPASNEAGRPALTSSQTNQESIMRRFGMSFLSPARETRQEIPPHRLHLIQQSFRRRLSDHIEDVLYRACTEDDTVTAEALYEVLES